MNTAIALFPTYHGDDCVHLLPKLYLDTRPPIFWTNKVSFGQV